MAIVHAKTCKLQRDWINLDLTSTASNEEYQNQLQCNTKLLNSEVLEQEKNFFSLSLSLFLSLSLIIYMYTYKIV